MSRFQNTFLQRLQKHPQNFGNDRSTAVYAFNAELLQATSLARHENFLRGTLLQKQTTDIWYDLFDKEKWWQVSSPTLFF
jgi:hypothetical protein